MLNLKIIHNGWVHYILKIISDFKISDEKQEEILKSFLNKFQNDEKFSIEKNRKWK